ncbi:hypothetical protein BU15DRAFT_41904 [Melanogaster broomeanus]|nr:hypothetical protein BU15DRAFT_41904 [Melanogaster broomeanus]
MDDFAGHDNQASTSQTPSENRQNGHGHSGITLVLPSLKAIKAAKFSKRSKQPKNIAFQQKTEPKLKAPRPIKLKPLREVLTKLITQIKKRDDYAFFICPVDPAQVPGYADVIKNPMDFGTMTVKVSKGKYRSLEEFTSDFRLVTTNAKIFNPPGTIYHAEADRLETWGIEHIKRASAHVIEYETDWNIDVEEGDDDPTTQQQPDVDGSIATGSPAPSLTPAPGQIQRQGPGPVRRGPRGPYKRHAPVALTESLDAEGRLPGSKDGVGAFPPGSEWAELMIALKIKGKRYRTKKERLRFEKEGPPYQSEGSLNYLEMEDPFSVLNVFVPDPPSRPQVTPLYRPATTPTPAALPTSDPSQAQLQPQSLQPHAYPTTPIISSENRPFPVLSTLSNSLMSTAAAGPPRPVVKRRHWTVVRNAPARTRLKDKDADGAGEEDVQMAWKVPRAPGPGDYGSFATLLADLAVSAPATGTGTGTSADGGLGYTHGPEQRLFSAIRASVDNRGTKRALKEDGRSDTFWTDDKAEGAWDYIRDVVYGGVDGYAYVRSLAEFVGPPVYLGGDGRDGDDDGELAYTPPEHHAMPLGVPLARYVEDNLVDAITARRHSFLRDLVFPLPESHSSPHPEPGPGPCLFQARLAALPAASCALAAVDAFNAEQLDMAALIRTPEELARESSLEASDWVGHAAEWLGGDRKVGETLDAIDSALEWGVGVIEELERRVRARAREGAGEEMGQNEWAGDEEDECARNEVNVKSEVVEDGGVDAREVSTRPTEGVKEEPEDDAMDIDPDLPPSPSRTPDGTSELEPSADADAATSDTEDILTKRLRMNLLALAKRAPLDKIARLPVELVPENIRGIVPTV